jgi:D-alanine-D-alanine ligase
MNKIDKHIEIVSSSVSSLSSMSDRSRRSIQATLSKYYTNVGITIVDDLASLKALVASNPDLVFLGMKFIPRSLELGINDPQKIWISRYLDAHKIAYTGSAQGAHKLDVNKQLAKQCVMNAGFRSSAYKIIHYDQSQSIKDIKLVYPMFVKPNNRGGGLGISSTSFVINTDQLSAKIASITTDLRSDSLIEEYLPGREFSVGILKSPSSSALSAMPIELVAGTDAQGISILGGDLKASNTEVVKEVTDRLTKRSVCELAINVFKALGARDYGRIDIRLDALGVPHFLEANLIPSLIDGYGSFPKTCAINANLKYDDMLLQIVNLGFARSSTHRTIRPVTIPVTPALQLG